jgi:hypothetical protein
LRPGEFVRRLSPIESTQFVEDLLDTDKRYAQRHQRMLERWRRHGFTEPKSATVFRITPPDRSTNMLGAGVAKLLGLIEKPLYAQDQYNGEGGYVVFWEWAVDENNWTGNFDVNTGDGGWADIDNSFVSTDDSKPINWAGGQEGTGGGETILIGLSQSICQEGANWILRNAFLDSFDYCAGAAAMCGGLKAGIAGFHFWACVGGTCGAAVAGRIVVRVREHYRSCTGFF